MTYGQYDSAIKEMIFVFKSEKLQELQTRKKVLEE